MNIAQWFDNPWELLGWLGLVCYFSRSLIQWIASERAGDSVAPLAFWLVAIANEFFVFYLLILMAYTVAFFGVSWPDRVVKRRLAKWLMRGPVTASLVLGFTTLIRRTGDFFGMPDTVAIPIIMVMM